MDILEFHKGSFCLYTSRVCQEGFCTECEIKHSQDNKRTEEPEDLMYWTLLRNNKKVEITRRI